MGTLTSPIVSFSILYSIELVFGGVKVMNVEERRPKCGFFAYFATMTPIRSYIILIAVLVVAAAPQRGRAQDSTKYAWKQASSGGYTYRYVTNDPMQSRLYTLSNGLTVMLSVNHKE